MTANSDIVIVGGGPIGLAYAWGLKKLNPNLKVTILEKYESYQRTHTLVMQGKQLEKLMKATGTENEPELVELLGKLKKDPHIRTNRLQEIFQKIAKDNGVEIITEEVQEKTIKQQIHNHAEKPKLIIGADGTHSVVSASLFPKGNQVKHEFDYVLQLRYEINGDHKSEAISPLTFYQSMARHGIIANEYVGHFEDGKTPVTMQMMISKHEFLKLISATSKKPITPFKEETPKAEQENPSVNAIPEPIQLTDDIKEETPKAEQENPSVNAMPEPIQLNYEDMPKPIKKFIDEYIAYKIKTCHSDEKIDPSSVRISVNEAPATHAKQVFNLEEDILAVLGGDAELGLSYFKGLNAGLESTAKFFSLMASLIKDGLVDAKGMQEALNAYQEWFLNDFAPKKIREVAQYSTWQIRSLMKVMKVARNVKMASKMEDDDIPTAVFNDYFKFFGKHPLATAGRGRLYPHRDYDPVKLGQFAYIPISHSLKKIGKLFVDFVKPYKSTSQFKQDWKQPLVGLVNVNTGVLKILVGLFTLNIKRIGDGSFSLLRGIVEIATTPLTWFLKPLTRGFATLLHRGLTKIEENSGMKKLANQGHETLDKLAPEAFKTASDESTYNMLAICNDMHRKFKKCVDRGQSSHIPEIEELTRFSAIRKDTQLNKDTLRDYFSLFHPKPDVQSNSTDIVVDKEDSSRLHLNAK